MNYSTVRSPVVARETYLEDMVRGKCVLHVGAAQGGSEDDDAFYREVVNSKQFLHRRLMDAAAQVVGLDHSRLAIQRLKDEFGIDNIVYGDMQDDTPLKLPVVPEVIVMGEIMEHLANPGVALSKLRAVMNDKTILVVTVPSAWSLWNAIMLLMGREAHDPDHRGLYSPRIATSLMEKCGLSVDKYLFYHNFSKLFGMRNYYNRELRPFAPRKAVLLGLFNVALRLDGRLADGLILEAHKKAG